MPEPQKIRPITAKRLMNIALYYLGRYDSSAEQLRRVLNRRVLKSKIKGAEVPEQVDQWIDDIITRVCNDGYVNDEQFTENQIRKLKSAGKSKQFIVNKLRVSGVASSIIQDKLEQNGTTDLESACLLVKKKKIGHYRAPDKQSENYKKDLSTLARAGFSFDIAVKALGTQNCEEYYE